MSIVILWYNPLLKINPVERIQPIPKELPPKTQEEVEAEKRKSKEKTSIDMPADTIDISDEALASLREVEESN